MIPPILCHLQHVLCHSRKLDGTRCVPGACTIQHLFEISLCKVFMNVLMCDHFTGAANNSAELDSWLVHTWRGRRRGKMAAVRPIAETHGCVIITDACKLGQLSG